VRVREISSYAYIDCDCGAHLVRHLAPQFEDACPLPFPSARDGERPSIAAADFVAWQLRASGKPQNDVYRVWLNRLETTDRAGRAVYFQAGGDDYSVFASLTPILVARKLPGGWLREKLLPAQKQSTGYAQTIIPRVEDRPGRWLRPPDEEGNVPISAEGFEDLFAGTGVELEALPFARAFEREIHELAVAAAHASSCGRPLHLRHV
jgi:hypothetical protein